MSEWITSDTGIQSCDPNPNSVATVEASTKSIFKNRPFRGGWGGSGMGAGAKSVNSGGWDLPGWWVEIQACCFIPTMCVCVFFLLTTGNNPLKKQLEV